MTVPSEIVGYHSQGNFTTFIYFEDFDQIDYIHYTHPNGSDFSESYFSHSDSSSFSKIYIDASDASFNTSDTYDVIQDIIVVTLSDSSISGSGTVYETRSIYVSLYNDAVIDPAPSPSYGPYRVGEIYYLPLDIRKDPDLSWDSLYIDCMYINQTDAEVCNPQSNEKDNFTIYVSDPDFVVGEYEFYVYVYRFNDDIRNYTFNMTFGVNTPPTFDTSLTTLVLNHGFETNVTLPTATDAESDPIYYFIDLPSGAPFSREYLSENYTTTETKFDNVDFDDDENYT